MKSEKTSKPSETKGKKSFVIRIDESTYKLVEKWANEAGMTTAAWLADPELMRRKLNDPENAFLRTGKGRL